MCLTIKGRMLGAVICCSMYSQCEEQYNTKNTHAVFTATAWQERIPNWLDVKVHFQH